MAIIGSQFWFGRRFGFPLCCDTLFSNSVACASGSFIQGVSCELFLSLLVGVVLWCAFIFPVSWSSSFPAPLWFFSPISWPVRAGRSPWRVCKSLGIGLTSFCARGWPCGGFFRWLDQCLDFVCLPPPHLLVVFPDGTSTSVLSSCLAI